MKRLLFIVNPISGVSSKESVVGTIASNIDMDKYDVTIRFTNHSGHATEIATKAMDDGIDVVVAVGGDGTVNEVAKALVKTSTILGIIPCGSGNGLARHLRIPMNVKKAVDVINAGIVDKIDTMIVNGKPCFCTAGVGYDAYVSAEYAKDPKRGIVTYAKKAIEGWNKYEPREYIIETDHQVLKRKAIAIICANANQWGNGFHVAPKASLQDGMIDVTIIHPIKFINAISMPAQILGYSFDKNPDVECFQSKKIEIKGNGVTLIQIDGEPFCGQDRVTIEILKHSLMVLK